MLNATQYPTFEVFIAIAVGALVTLVLLPFWIKLLRHRQIGQQVRADGPQGHLVKQGTPTMGGVVLIVAMLITVYLLDFPGGQATCIIIATVLTALVGFIDDISKVVKKRSLGLSASAKMAALTAISLGFCVVLVSSGKVAPTVSIPLTSIVINLGVLTTTFDLFGITIVLPWLYMLFVFFLFAGLSNAVNLTDGVDGLAGGTILIVMIVMAAIAFRADRLDTALIAAAAAGTCIGFLWFNSHPAAIFMGDTGSLAFGALLAGIAVVTKAEVVSLIIGGIFVAEALSVMIQVASFKLTGKRVFLMAPFHHHFEKKGWSETQVMVRFWIITAALAGIGFAMYFTGTL